MENAAEKTALVLTEAYYPNAFVGAHRAAKFARYLREHGWMTLVVCSRARRDNTDMYDDALLASPERQAVLHEVPQRKIERSKGRRLALDILFSLQHPDMLYHAITSRLFSASRYKSPIEYYCHTQRFLDRYLAKHPVDVVFATFPPGATLALAARLNQKYGIPWVADFRDTIDMTSIASAGPIHERMAKSESLLLQTASRVITVSEPLQSRLQRRLGRDVDVIPNGFDENDYFDLETVVFDRLTIVYVGTMYRQWDVRPLFKSVARLMARGQIGSDEIAIRFYGRNMRLLLGQLQEFPELGQIVQAASPIPRAEALRLQKSASVLLVLSHPAEPGVLTGKLLDYLGARRPVLCVPGDNGAIDSFLRDTGVGLSCGTESELDSAILNWISEWRKIRAIAYQGDEDKVRGYSRRKQAERLAAVLDEVVMAAPPRHYGRTR